MRTFSRVSIRDISKLVFLGRIKVHPNRTSVAFAGKECLMILCGQVHVIVREGLLVGSPVKSLILRAPEKIDRIAPDLTLGHILVTRGASGAAQARTIAIVGAVAAADPWRDVVQGHLLDERGAILPEVPPLEDEDQAGDEGRSTGEGDVEFWG